jgi:hypothetical protein
MPQAARLCRLPVCLRYSLPASLHASPPQSGARLFPEAPASGQAHKNTLAPAAARESHASPTPIPTCAACLDAPRLDAFRSSHHALLPLHESRIPNAQRRTHSGTSTHDKKLTSWTRFVRSIHALGPDSACITPDILRKCALVARHESPSSSVRLSGGSQFAESTATMRRARPMIERTRTWRSPSQPPAVLG